MAGPFDVDLLKKTLNLKGRLLKEYVAGLTEAGSYVQPKLDWTRLVRSISRQTAPEGELPDRAWAILDAKRQHRMAVGIRQGQDGAPSLGVKLGKKSEEAEAFASVLRNAAPTALVEFEEENYAKKRVAPQTNRIAPKQVDRPERPLRLGLSVGVGVDSAGSIGPFVKGVGGINCSLKAGRFGFLGDIGSLAPGEIGVPDQTVYQPARADNAGRSLGTKIGRVADFVELTRSSANDSPAALVEVDAKVQIAGNVVPSDLASPLAGKRISSVAQNPLEVIGKKVGKVGRTSNYTTGVVSMVELDGLIVRFGRRNLLMNGLIEVTTDRRSPFSLPGDSGALVFLEESGEALGLVFGSSGTGTSTYVIRLDKCLDVFGVELAS